MLEDEAIIAFALEDMLVADGANVIMAASLEEAEALIHEGGIGSAVLDVNVHGEKSYGIGAKLQSLDIPFVFATGYGDTSHPPEFAKTPTVSKPYTHEQIKSAMARARLGPASALLG
ncbi:response regulator [Erythrobacter sp. QSSC1-22B]|uniref:response regulator n=1 Tax=Erythrobacter sp. QSSC1-22B TaxID=1860125 RepID=UPI00143A7D7F|nr:response regulator [Erythrobacter sp. QSSC1-22B]